MPVVRKDQEGELRQSAKAHREALAPSVEVERQKALAGLRLRTIPRTEGEQEAMARHRELVNDLADVPADILQAACDAYVNTPGNRFTPTAGELRAHITPLITRRMARAKRLAQMADEAAQAFDEDSRCTPEQARAILDELGMKSVFAEPGVRDRTAPTAEDYIALGHKPEDAERFAAADRARLAKDKTAGRAQ